MRYWKSIIYDTRASPLLFKLLLTFQYRFQHRFLLRRGHPTHLLISFTRALIILPFCVRHIPRSNNKSSMVTKTEKPTDMWISQWRKYIKTIRTIMAAAIVTCLAVANIFVTFAYGRSANYGKISIADLPRLFDVSKLVIRRLLFLGLTVYIKLGSCYLNIVVAFLSYQKLYLSARVNDFRYVI